MKTIKNLVLAVAGIVSSQLFAGYVFNWTLSDVPENYNYDYAQIAVYAGDADKAYLYFNAETPSRYYSWYRDSNLYASADVSAIVAAYNNGNTSYSFIIELFNDYGVIGESASYTYEGLLAGNLDWYDEPYQPTDKVADVTYNIPEPSSVLMLLAGLMLLGLKRKARKVLLPCLLVAVMTGFGEANLTFVTLKSDGPDKYADGTVVKNGERYAVVYAADPGQVKFLANGKVTGGTLVLTSPIAKDGGCPETCFQLGENLTKDCSGGDYKLFLLDTRLADGSIAPAVNGKVPLVNGYALVEGASVQVSAISELPSDTPKVEFTDIEVGDEWVSLTMKNTVPYVQYTVDDDEASVSNGKADLNDTITITVPRKDGGQTFKARRK